MTGNASRRVHSREALGAAPGPGKAYVARSGNSRSIAQCVFTNGDLMTM
jgi:hypothetical protein